MTAEYITPKIDHLTEGSLTWLVTLVGGAALLAGVVIVLMVIKHNAALDAQHDADDSPGVDQHYGEKTRYALLLSTVAAGVIAVLALIGTTVWAVFERQRLDTQERALALNMKLNYDIYGAEVQLSLLDGSPLGEDIKTFDVTVLTDIDSMQQMTAHYDTDEGIAVLVTEPGQDAVPVRESSPLSAIK